jgi:hypothetical protein
MPGKYRTSTKTAHPEHPPKPPKQSPANSTGIGVNRPMSSLDQGVVLVDILNGRRAKKRQSAKKAFGYGLIAYMIFEMYRRKQQATYWNGNEPHVRSFLHAKIYLEMNKRKQQ